MRYCTGLCIDPAPDLDSGTKGNRRLVFGIYQLIVFQCIGTSVLSESIGSLICGKTVSQYLDRIFRLTSFGYLKFSRSSETKPRTKRQRERRN